MKFLRSILFKLRNSHNKQYLRGLKGEAEAVKFLKKRHYKILERNFKYGKYELDIIAEYKGCIVFVEVRGRSVNDLHGPYASVDKHKKISLKRAIFAYLKQNKQHIFSYRFDIITIDWNTYGETLAINHYESIPIPT